MGTLLACDLKFHLKSIFSISSDGKLWLHLGNLQGDNPIEQFRDAFANAAKDKLGVSIPNDYIIKRYPSVDIKHWGPRVETFINLLDELSAKYLSHNSQ